MQQQRVMDRDVSGRQDQVYRLVFVERFRIGLVEDVVVCALRGVAVQT